MFIVPVTTLLVSVRARPFILGTDRVLAILDETQLIFTRSDAPVVGLVLFDYQTGRGQQGLAQLLQTSRAYFR
ncbi:hypothetical protein QNI15_36905 [Cytophagaceae bacterium NT2B1]|nr:hypothetical protein [Xanthocytophaga flavus]